MGRRGFQMRLLLGLVVAGISFFSYWNKSQVNPITGESQRVSLSPAQEVAMGLQSAPEMAAQFGGLLENEELQRGVKAIGYKLVHSSEAANSPYQFNFHVLADDQTVNAFALPGGQIFITLALIKQLKQDKTLEDQIAGVLGHEIGHVVNRHSAEHMAKQELTSGLVGAVGMAVSDPGSPQGAAAIANYVGNVVGMKFGREDETESDLYGVKYMLQAGYNPESLISVMEVLARVSGDKRQSEFMSSHPYPENRMIEIKKTIERYKSGELKI